MGDGNQDARLHVSDDFVPPGDLPKWLVEATPDGILIADVNGRIVLVNDQLGKLFAYAPDELLDRPVEVLMPTELRRGHVAFRGHYWANPLSRPMGAGLNLSGLRKDGTEFPVDISLSPLVAPEPLALACIRDISDRVIAEERVVEIAHLLDQAAHALFAVDAESLEISYANEAAATLTGFRNDELAAMTAADLEPALVAAEVHDLLAPVVGGKSGSLVRTSVLRRKDGSDVPVEIASSAAEPVAGGEPQVLLLVTDISERLRAEASLRRSAEELRVSEERDRIARDLHDTVIQSLFATGLGLQSLRARIDDEEVAARLDASVEQVDVTIAEIRSTIFDVQARADGLDPDFASRVFDITRELTPSLGFEPDIRFHSAEEPPAEVVEQALPTLREALTNVAKHSGATRAVIQIGVGINDDWDDWFEMHVIDDGTGLDRDTLAQRGSDHGSDSVENDHNGHGLQNMVARAGSLGGSCSVTSVSGGGCSVVWRVPV